MSHDLRQDVKRNRAQRGCDWPIHILAFAAVLGVGLAGCGTVAHSDYAGRTRVPPLICTTAQLPSGQTVMVCYDYRDIEAQPRQQGQEPTVHPPAQRETF